MKFDGVAGNKDKELEDPKGYGAIEFAYSLMAKAAGVTMSECRLLEENGRRHFMSRRFAGHWSLAPAFDLTYSYNPAGIWTASHQMTMNGKRDGFTFADFRACAKSALMKRGRAEAIVEEVRAAMAKWPDHAEQAQVMSDRRKQIQRSHRLELART